MLRFAQAILITGWVLASVPALSQGSGDGGIVTGGGILTGTVTSTDGKPLEGVAVSAKAEGSTITTSVWSNREGVYTFPPLADGRYRVRAQAVGFTLTRAEQTLASGKRVRQDFALPPYEEVWRQLDDSEWLASLPEGLPEDRGIPGRMKRVLHYTCDTCHNTAFYLEKRFTRADWELLFNHMAERVHPEDPPYGAEGKTFLGRDVEFEDDIPGGGQFPTKIVDDKGRRVGAQRRLMELYREDILSYLAKVRGPEPYPIKWQPFPRPTGEATSIVVTEYDLPATQGLMKRLDPKTGRFTNFDLNPDGSTTRIDNPEYYINEYRDGSDWSRGIQNRSLDLGEHDVENAPDGYAYIPPSTGNAVDPDGNFWFDVGPAAVKFDVKTEKYTRYPVPEEWFAEFSNGKATDSKGRFWANIAVGVYRLDPKNGEWTPFLSRTPLGRPYGLTIDREDTAWFAQIAIDKIGYVDGKTDEVGEVAMPPIDDEPMTAEDRAANRGFAWVQPLYGKGPRRLQADPNGDYVYACLYYGGRLAKINIKTKEVTEYKLPDMYRLGMPYEPAVDKNGIVWFSMANADVFGRFDPHTEQFTFYPLPTRGHNARNIDVVNTPAGPEVWLPYTSVGKVARVRFLTPQEK